MENAARCPACGAEIAPGGACPRCAIAVPGERPPPDPRIAEGEPPRPPLEVVGPAAPLPPPLATAWLRVQGALTVLHVGVILGFVGGLVLAVGFAVPLLEQAGRRGGAPGSPVAPAVGPLLTLAALAVLVGWVVRLVGQCLACAVPEESGGRGWAVGSVVCGLASLLAGVLAVVVLVFAVVGALGDVHHPEILPGPEGGPGRSPLLPVVAVVLLVGSGLAALAEVVCVALFLRAVAGHFGAKPLARRAGEYARFFATFAVVLFAFNFFSGYLLRLLPGDPETKARMIPILLVVEMGCFLILAAQFLGLIRETRDTVARARGAGNPPVDATQPSR